MANLYEIVERLGGEVSNGGRCALIPGPGHSRKDRSLSLRLSDQEDRVIFFSHANDPNRVVMEYLGIEARHGDERMAMADRARFMRARAEAEQKAQIEDRRFCDEIWAGTIPLEGSAAEAYLWSRGIILEGCAAIRFHPAAPRSKPKPDGEVMPRPGPAMVALVTDRDGNPLALHLTYILPDGTGKAPGRSCRLMFGSVGGGSVRLAPIAPSGVLAVSEGIETGAAFMQQTGTPTWACLSTAGLAKVLLPSTVRKLVIAADNDANEAGLNAAKALAERAQRFCDVEIRMPAEEGDWADHVKEAHRV